MKYTKGYRYQLVEDYEYVLNFHTRESVELSFIVLVDNRLLIKKGYAWDGASGPAIDTESFIVGSLVHDVLYQLMRGDYISIDCRENADKELRMLCLKYGMNRFRAWYVYQAVHYLAKSAALPRNVKKIFEIEEGKHENLTVV